ncbi:MAG: hypothetical protein A2033_03025 [Bacteroidetes bacterium GWA2_31_9]|nr:MAG: hypothetical protein A2033_03025 [Bacteroidetes bacterium GWA2_31_9]
MKINEKINAKNNSCILRNEAIIYRYYFWSEKIGLKKQKVKELISREFYITQCTVQEILYDNKKLINEVNEKRPSLRFLSRKYPFSIWNKNMILDQL